MSKRLARLVMCMRCTATTSLNKPDARWNMAYEKGYLKGYLCPNCQTPEENAEAEINSATTDLAGFDQQGRTWGRRRA